MTASCLESQMSCLDSVESYLVYIQTKGEIMFALTSQSRAYPEQDNPNLFCFIVCVRERRSKESISTMPSTKTIHCFLFNCPLILFPFGFCFRTLLFHFFQSYFPKSF